MDDKVKRLKTPEDCMQFAKNVRDKKPELAQEARRRAVELRALAHGTKNEVELELVKAVHAYEEVLYEKNNKRVRANRTWQMIKRHGIIEAAARAVDRKIETAGYISLIEMGMPDLTFEAVIVRYPEAFSPEVVSRAKQRLEEVKKLSLAKGGNEA